MNKAILTIITFVLCSCDNTSEKTSLYGEWYRYKTIEKETVNNQTSTNEEIYDPKSDDYLDAEIIRISKEVMYTFSFSITSIVDSNVAYVNPKENLNYKLLDDELIIYQTVKAGPITIEYENFYKIYKGDFPPQSWKDNVLTY